MKPYHTLIDHFDNIYKITLQTITLPIILGKINQDTQIHLISAPDGSGSFNSSSSTLKVDDRQNSCLNTKEYTRVYKVKQTGKSNDNPPSTSVLSSYDSKNS